MADRGGSHDDFAAQAARRARFAHAKAVFCQALDRSVRSRSAFVEQACAGDETLRREVDSLLLNDEQGGSFIEHPAAGLLPAVPSPGGAPPPPQLRPGAPLGPYLIEELLGSGGMGEVYRARDTRLRRTVAVKIVACAQAGEAGHAALLREARHASALSHAGICAVHEVGGEADGRPYIVMEHIEGETLRQRVARCGRLPRAEVLRHGERVAEALDHAHRRGVVHRDLKSANIMLPADGGVKVLDFGLSCWLPGAAGQRASTSFATEALALAGTLEYMAPEVLLGGVADARSDIWSLGIVLFEMATGRPAFRGQTPFETASAILQARRPVFPRGVALGLRLVIARCLTRDPARRYQRAAEAGAALHALRSRGAAAGRVTASLAWRQMRSRLVAAAAAVVTVAVLLAAGTWLTLQAGASPPRVMRALLVLPLMTPPGGESERYFADGVTEELISAIGETGLERVISPASAMRFRGGRRTRSEIATELGVDAILEGTIGRSDDRVTLSVRLHDGASGREVWSTRQTRTPREVSALVAKVASDVAGGMRHSIREDAGGRLSAVRAVAPDVYEAYLKGRYYWNRRTDASLHRAVAFYKSALRMDPTYAPAEAALADCYNQLGTVMVGVGSPGDFRPLAAASAIRALQIDPNLPDAHATLGYIRHYEWQWRESEREFVQAIGLNPNNALAHVWYANLLASLRRIPEALREVEIGRELDPFSLVVNTNVGWTLWYAGRAEEAIAQYRKVLQLEPGYVQARLRLGGALAARGDYEGAIAEFQEAARLTGSGAPSRAGLAQVYATTGRRAEARALLEQLLRDSLDRYVSPASIAGVYESLGDADSAFTWLEKAYAEHSNHIAYLAVDRHTGLRGDPRFGRLLRRIGLE